MRVRNVLLIGAACAALTLTGCSGDVSATPSSQPTSSCAGSVVAGLSAFELWISQGNSGTVQDFFDALVGKKGQDGYIGADGINGAPGAPGEPGKVPINSGLNRETPEPLLIS